MRHDIQKHRIRPGARHFPSTIQIIMHHSGAEMLAIGREYTPQDSGNAGKVGPKAGLDGKPTPGILNGYRLVQSPTPLSS